MVTYNGGVAVVCFVAALIVWRFGTISPAFVAVDVLLGALNAYAAISRWRREHRQAVERERERWEEWP